MRRELAVEYFNKKQIYGGFFTRWGGDFKIVMLKNDFIDIIANVNPEWNRGHVIKELTADAELELRIIKLEKDGIYVMGKNMKEPKFLRY